MDHLTVKPMDRFPKDRFPKDHFPMDHRHPSNLMVHRWLDRQVNLVNQRSHPRQPRDHFPMDYFMRQAMDRYQKDRYQKDCLLRRLRVQVHYYIHYPMVRRSYRNTQAYSYYLLVNIYNIRTFQNHQALSQNTCLFPRPTPTDIIHTKGGSLVCHGTPKTIYRMIIPSGYCGFTKLSCSWKIPMVEAKILKA